ncbi:MAG: amylo-alpha-1,6-glucosidase, partial [Chloroflexota bacterium]|nr:amylo-alpha-1,6-glucosidase [Chloroflexota bacterium]
PRDKAPRVARRLLAPDLFSGWGVRTLSSDNPAYNPFSYHRGSVWPVENATFAFGLARYGCWEELAVLARAIFDLSDLFVSNRLPEVIGGPPRDDHHPHPGIYPESHEPQGWSASMIVMLVQALLGLYPIAPLGIVAVDPHLPEWIPELRLSGVRVGTSVLDLEFLRRANGATDYLVVRRQGRARVVRQPVPDGLEATLWRRFVDLARSVPRL